MNMHGVGGHGFSYPSFLRSPAKAADTAPAPAPPSDDAPAASPPTSPASPGFRTLSGALAGNVTGAVTAHLPNGIELGIYSFAPIGSDQGDADAPGGSPDYAAMTAAIEDMVDHFMAATAAAAKSAYQQRAYEGAQRGAAGFLA